MKLLKLLTPRVRIVLNVVSFLLGVNIIAFSAQHGLPFPWLVAGVSAFALVMIAADTKELRRE